MSDAKKMEEFAELVEAALNASYRYNEALNNRGLSRQFRDVLRAQAVDAKNFVLDAYSALLAPPNTP